MDEAPNTQAEANVIVLSDHLSTIGDAESRLVTCIACGGLTPGSGQPRIRCQECGTVGYVDRAGRNLVPVNWECLNCGAQNDGSTNFCLECSQAMTTVCLRCEFPVYTSVCGRCGSHQDALVRMHSLEEERATWMPLRQSLLESQQPIYEAPPPPVRKIEEAYHAQPEPISTIPAASAVPTRASQPTPRSPSRNRRRRRRNSQFGWAVMWIIGGFFMLSRQISAATIDQVTTGALQLPLIASLDHYGVIWLKIASALMASPQSVDTASSGYAAFFMVTIFGVAALPLIGYVAFRFLRRWVF